LIVIYFRYFSAEGEAIIQDSDMMDGQQIILDEVNGQQIVLQSGQSGQQESSNKLFTF
jgi:hypothetical protein